MAETIETKLTESFAPESVQVIDESEQHRGHGGWREGGETHFKVVMRAGVFNGLSRVDRSRRVHAVLRDELATSVHALALDLSGTEA
jgi:BolA protein